MTGVRINRALNLVLKLETESAGEIHIHSVPVSREVFERYFIVMARTFARIMNEGLGTTAGPRVAYLMLKEVSGGAAEGETPQAQAARSQWEDVKRGLINEIVRLSNACVLGDKGWEDMPLHTAFERNILGEDDRLDVESELVFFTLVARMNKRSQIEGLMSMAGALWGSLTTSLSITDYLNSLRTLTVNETSGVTVPT